MDVNVIERKVDNLGRFVIPNHMRKLLGINANDKLMVYTDGERVIIKPIFPRCPLCKGIIRDNKQICDECIALIKEM